MGRQRQKGLSEKHKRVLSVLEYYNNEVGYPPTIREICDRANLSSTSVANYYLERLEEKGYIERDRGVSRGLRLVKPYEESVKSVGEQIRAAVDTVKSTVDELLSIPVAGRIVASEPLFTPSSDFSYTDFEGSAINIAKSMLPAQDQKQGNLFALEVSGDSMIDAMVNDGDMVIMRPVQEVKNGEMVAVWLNDNNETTLKYYHREGKRVRLQPANPTMDAIYIDDPSTVEIKGKVVMVIRQTDSH
ncbi:MAG: transcriptional repressor LexA [Chloroflexota bacterium]